MTVLPDRAKEGAMMVRYGHRTTGGSVTLTSTSHSAFGAQGGGWGLPGMKIVHVLLGKANPETMNGVNKVVHNVATEQLRAGNDVEVWGLTGSAEGARHAHEYPLVLFATTRSRFRLTPELVSSLRTLPLDAWVQLHSVFIPEFRAIASALRRRRQKFGVTPHGGYSPHVLGKDRWKKALYFRLIESSVLRHAALVQAIGATEVNDVLRLAPDANVVLVPNGQAPLESTKANAADSTIASADRAVREADDQHPIFCYCGRIAIDHKGLDLLVEGFHGYKRDGGEGTLWIVGDGADRTALEAHVERSGLRQDVRFLGARFGTEKLALLRECDVFVHTSRWDVVPTAVLEAAALGLALLVTRETNLGDAVEAWGAGVVVPMAEADAITMSLKHMAREHALGRTTIMGDHAAAMVETDFAWPRLAGRLVDAYRAAQATGGSYR